MAADTVELRQQMDTVLGRFYPYEIAISPNGTLAVQKIREGSVFRLEVVSVADGRVVCVDQSSANQVSVTWGPDGQEIAFQEPSAFSAGYDFFLMDSKSCHRNRLQVESSDNALAPLRFSPTRHELLILSGLRTHEQLTLCTLDDFCKSPRTISSEARYESQFGWSPDGRRVAFTKPGRSLTLVVTEVDNFNVNMEIPIEEATFPGTFDWSPSHDSRVLVLAPLRQSRGSFLSVVDLDDRRKSELRRFPAEFREQPVWMSDGKHYLTHRLDADGSRRIFLGAEGDSHEAEVAPSLGAVRSVVGAVVNPDTVIVSAVDLGQRPQLYRVSLSGAVPPLLVLPHGSEVSEPVPYPRRFVDANPSAGVVVPALYIDSVLSAQEEDRKAIFLVVDDARSLILDPFLNPAIVEFSRRGLAVVALLMGEIEDPNTQARIIHLQLRNYIHATGIDVNNISLLASSKFGKGAAMASFLGSGFGRRGGAGIASLHLLSVLLDGPRPGGIPPRSVMSYFGSLDPVASESRNRQSMSAWYGSIRESCRKVETFPNERHTFQRVATWSHILSNILAPTVCSASAH